METSKKVTKVVPDCLFFSLETQYSCYVTIDDEEECIAMVWVHDAIGEWKDGYKSA